MEETLSREEVDALLRGMAEGELSVKDARPAGTIRAIDVFSVDRVAGAKLPAIDVVHERLARELPASLAAAVGPMPPAVRGEHEVLSFQTMRNRIAPGSLACLFTMAPLRRHGALVVGAPLVHALTDRVFGGTGRVPASLGERPYSEIVRRAFRRVAERMLDALGTAFAPFVKLECAFLGAETDPAVLDLAAPEDMVASLELSCDAGSGPEPLLVVMPCAALEPLRAKAGAPQGAAGANDREWAAAMRTAVCQADVTVSAELGRLDMAARAVLRLRVGDLLPLDARRDDPLAVRVEGKRLVRALAGVSRGRNAMRVVAMGTGD